VSQLPNEIKQKLDGQHNDVMELLHLLGRTMKYLNDHAEQLAGPDYENVLVDIETTLIASNEAAATEVAAIKGEVCGLKGVS